MAHQERINFKRYRRGVWGVGCGVWGSGEVGKWGSGEGNLFHLW
ncbi:hypothetical protein [Microcystis aeruginosa]|nr:hypothetical protein [Microcystis aeruginosa]